MAELIYGIRNSDGKVVSIDDVPSGLQCDCRCPICNENLIAKKGEIKESHFAHYGMRDKTSNCDAVFANETSLHMLAKQIIEEEGMLVVPAIEVGLWEVELNDIPYELKEKLKSFFTYKEAEKLIFQTVELEKKLPGFKPDLVCSTSNLDYFIEVAVTHFVDEEKKKKIEKYKMPMLEIDLSEYLDEPISKKELRNVLLNSTKNKEWLYHPEYEKAKIEAKKFYENSQEFKEINAKMKRREKAEKKVNSLLKPENYSNTLKNLRNDKSFFSRYKSNSKEFSFYEDHKQIPFFIDIPITGEMIFKCDRRIWQGIIFNRYIYYRKENSNSINNFTIFNALKENYNISIDYELAFLNLESDNSYETYSFSRDVINRYLIWMEMLGFIKIRGKWSTVLERKTIIPPNKKNAEWLKEALEEVDIYSPDIDKLLTAHIRKREEEHKKQLAEKAELLRIEKQKKEEEEKRKAEEEALNKAKNEYIQGKLQIEKEDFNQEKYIYDQFGYRWFKCRDCNKLFRGDDKMSTWRYSIGQCNECGRK